MPVVTRSQSASLKQGAVPVVTRSQSASLKQDAVPLNDPSVGGLTIPPVPLGKPSVGELVYVLVLNKPTDMGGVYVKMIKYDLEGYILSCEFDKEFFKGKHKYKINDIYLAKVIKAIQKKNSMIYHLDVYR